MKDFMKKNHFFTYSKMCVLALTGASALFLASCAKDGYDDESFDSGVNNTQVSSIAVDVRPVPTVRRRPSHGQWSWEQVAIVSA